MNLQVPLNFNNYQLMANLVRNMDFEPDDRKNELYSTRQIGSVPLRLQDLSFCKNVLD